MVCVGEKIMCDRIDCMYTHMYTLKYSTVGPGIILTVDFVKRNSRKCHSVPD